MATAWSLTRAFSHGHRIRLRRICQARLVAGRKREQVHLMPHATSRLSRIMPSTAGGWYRLHSSLLNSSIHGLGSYTTNTRGHGYDRGVPYGEKNVRSFRASAVITSCERGGRSGSLSCLSSWWGAVRGFEEEGGGGDLPRVVDGYYSDLDHGKTACTLGWYTPHDIRHRSGGNPHLYVGSRAHEHAAGSIKVLVSN